MQAYNQWIQKELGESMQQAKMATGIHRTLVIVITIMFICVLIIFYKLLQVARQGSMEVECCSYEVCVV